MSSAPSPGLPSLVAAGEAGWADSPSQAHLPMTSGSQARLREGEGGKEGLAKACPKAPSLGGTGDLNWGYLRGGRRGSRHQREGKGQGRHTGGREAFRPPQYPRDNSKHSWACATC